MDERKFNYQFYRLAPGRRLAIALDLGLVDYKMCERIPLAFFSDIVQVARETDKIEALVKAVERANNGVQPTADDVKQWPPIDPEI